jgi:hypothetical protein
VLQIELNLDTRITSTLGTSSQKRFFPSHKISLSILDELEELGFGEIGRSLRDSWGQSHGFTPMMDVDDEAHPSTQLYGRNQRKTPNSWMKNQAKILQKSQKTKMIHTTWRQDSCTKISYIERIKCLQGMETATTSSHSLEDWRDLSLSLLSSLTP